jgi:hypothetical protein
VRVGPHKAFALRKPAKEKPGRRDHSANGARAIGQADHVDELIGSLAEAVGTSERKTSVETRHAQQQRPRPLPAGRARMRRRRRPELVSREVVLYIAAAVALGFVIGVLAPRLFS